MPIKLVFLRHVWRHLLRLALVGIYQQEDVVDHHDCVRASRIEAR